MADLTYSVDTLAYMNKLAELAKLEVKVGYQNGVQNNEGMSIAEYAYYNQFGTTHTPARPFMSDAFEKHTDEIQAFIAQQISAVAAGGSPDQALQQIGAYTKGLIQEEIIDGNFAPNAPSTIRRKMKKGKNPKPLIDTGAMLQNVNFTVVSAEDD